MYIALRSILRGIFKFLNLGLVRNTQLEDLYADKIDYENLRVKLKFYLEIISKHPKISITIEKLLNHSKSESGQDLFAMLANNSSEDMVFIEIGAFDGVTYSNSYLLEKSFNWTGILVECVPRNFREIKKSRDCVAIFGAVSDQDIPIIRVFESPAPNLSSTVKKESDTKWRVTSHSVPNYSLKAILEMGLAMGEIGFLSVDIEGAEHMVFKDIDLSRYAIKAICIEHNFRPENLDLKKLMEAQGYRSVYEEFSGNDFWFIRS